MTGLQPKITVFYDGQDPLSRDVNFVEIHWDQRLFVKRVYTSEEELAKEDRRGRIILPIETAKNTYDFRHVSKEDEEVNSWP